MWSTVYVAMDIERNTVTPCPYGVHSLHKYACVQLRLIELFICHRRNNKVHTVYQTFREDTSYCDEGWMLFRVCALIGSFKDTVRCR